MSVVNLGEVWDSIARTNSPEVADQYVGEVEGMAIEVVDADWQLTRQAAAFKATGNFPMVIALPGAGKEWQS